MPESPSRFAVFFAELRRRRVFRVTAVYAGVAFVIFQIIDSTFVLFGIPDWVGRFLVIALVLGLPLVIALGWVFDITEKGVVRTAAKGPKEAKVPRRLLISNRVLIIVVIVAVGVAAWSWWSRPGREAAVAAETGLGRRSIAVLPLDNIGGDPEQEYFVEGMHDALISALSNINAVTVISRRSTLQYKDSEKTMPTIASELGVDAMVEGSALLLGERVRITTQLIDNQDRHLWSNTYERNLEDVFALYNDVTLAIAQEIQAKLTTEEETRLASAPKVNPDAYESYLRGKYLWGKRQNQQDIVIARSLLEMAIELDNNLLSAKLQLGQSYRETGDYSDAMKIFHECLEESRAIGDRISEAMSLSSIGDIHLSSGHYEEALVYYEQSLELARNLGAKLTEQSILRNMGSAYYSKDEIEPALMYYKESLEIALELENRRAEGETLYDLGSVYLETGDYDGAMDSYSKSLRIFYELGDKSQESYYRRAEGETLHNLGSAYVETGDYDRAMDSYSQSIRIFHELGEKSQESYSGIGIGIVYARMGNYDAALARLTESLEMAREISDKRSEIYSLINIGAIHIQLGQDDKALEYYQEALEIAQSIGDTYLEGISWTKLGELMARRGEYAQSSQYFNSGCNIWRDLDDLSHHVWTLSWWALSEIRAGNIEEGSRKAGQVETMLAEILPYEEYVITVDWNLSQTYVELGDTAKAKIYVQKAYTEVMSRAERFTDQKDRNAFLNNIIENRNVISAYQRFDELGG